MLVGRLSWSEWLWTPELGSGPGLCHELGRC